MNRRKFLEWIPKAMLGGVGVVLGVRAVRAAPAIILTAADVKNSPFMKFVDGMDSGTLIHKPIDFNSWEQKRTGEMVDSEQVWKIFEGRFSKED